MTPEDKIKALEAEVKKLKKDYRDYAYIVSHDLSGPFRHAYGFSQLVLDKDAESLSPSSQKYLALVMDACRTGKDMLEGLLEFSRVNTSKEEVGEISLGESVQLNVALFSHHFNEGDMDVTMDALPTVCGVPSQIQAVLRALMHNALIYRKADEPAHVHISCEDKGDMWHIRVADQGIGLAQKQFEKIFLPLQRAVREDEFAGIGMGLAIAKRIVERHGGEISVSSTPDQGSVFSFTLPKVVVLESDEV